MKLISRDFNFVEREWDISKRGITGINDARTVLTWDTAQTILSGGAGGQRTCGTRGLHCLLLLFVPRELEK